MTVGIDPQMSEENQRRLLEALAHALLWGSGTYESPHDQAIGLLKRLDHEGFRIVETWRAETYFP